MAKGPMVAITRHEAVLVLTGRAILFFLVVCMMLWFGFVMKTVLTTR